MESVSEAPITVGLITERTRFPAPGLAGGRPGGLGAVAVNGRPVDTRLQHSLHKGDLLLMSTPGGGGFGDPAGRSGAAEERDARLGYVS
jgi:N-methylhydantoinase B